METKKVVEMMSRRYSTNELVKKLNKYRKKYELLENVLSAIDDLFSYDGTVILEDNQYKKLLDDLTYYKSIITQLEQVIIDRYKNESSD